MFDSFPIEPPPLCDAPGGTFSIVWVQKSETIINYIKPTISTSLSWVVACGCFDQPFPPHPFLRPCPAADIYSSSNHKIDLLRTFQTKHGFCCGCSNDSINLNAFNTPQTAPRKCVQFHHPFHPLQRPRPKQRKTAHLIAI